MATLVGVVSWGYGCATAGYPGVYAKVDSALDWLQTFIASPTTIETTVTTTTITTTTSAAVSTTIPVVSTSTTTTTETTTTMNAPTSTTTVEIMTTVETTSTMTLTPPPSGTSMWLVTSGPCKVDGDCVSSPNFPQQYSNNEACVIGIDATKAKPIVVKQFDTEKGYDKLVVNGWPYSGVAGPDGALPIGTVQWSSDISLVRAGWQLCAASTLAPTPAPTPAPSLHEPVCNGDASTNIVVGADAPKCGHPWMLSLQTSSNFHFCGGSLIDATHVLSAAHCCANMGNGAGYKAVIGDWKIETNNIVDRCPGEQTRTFSAVDMHPSYNPLSTSNDLCVITLATPVVAGTLVPQLASARPTDGTCTSVIGWGTTAAGGSSPDILQTVDVPIVSDAECASSYSGYEPGNMLCAGYSAGGHDSCQGDSGGPHFTVADGMATLVGVVSWGYGCATAGYPGVYAKVDSALDWLQPIKRTVHLCIHSWIACGSATISPRDHPDQRRHAISHCEVWAATVSLTRVMATSTVASAQHVA